MIIASLSDFDLHSSTLLASQKEKLATLDLLNHLMEINRRKLFVEYGCPSLHKYVVTQLKYSPAGHLSAILATATYRTSCS